MKTLVFLLLLPALCAGQGETHSIISARGNIIYVDSLFRGCEPLPITTPLRPGIDRRITTPPDTVMGRCTITYGMASPEWIGQMLWRWDAYKAECYADSVKHDRAEEGFEVLDTANVTYHPTSGGFTLEYSTATCPRFYWEHREPTFSGFMEYLRSQK